MEKKKFILTDVNYPLSEFEIELEETPQYGHYIFNPEMDSMWYIVLGLAFFADKTVLYVGPSDHPVTSILKRFNK